MAATETISNDTTTETTVYEVPEQNLADLRGAFDKLCKRARRLRVPEPTMEVGDEPVRELREWRRECGDMVYRAMEWMPPSAIHAKLYTATGKVERWFGVTVEGEAPRLPGGWRFVATLSPLPQEGGEAVNLIKRVPGQECPNSYAEPASVGICDHCNTHRSRKETFVVCNDAGEYRAVGRSCLKDFLGHTDPNRLASWATWLAELGTVCGGYSERGHSRTVETYTLESYLTTVAQVVSVRGFLGTGRARDEGGTATVAWVSLLLNPTYNDTAKQEKAALAAEITAKDNGDKCREQAAAAIAWALGLDVDALMDGGSDYLLNLALVVRAGHVGPKTMGLAASLPTAYLRAMDKLEAAKAKAARPASNHIGTIKKREEFVVTVKKVILKEGMYGTTHIHIMEGNVAAAAAGDMLVNDMTWFASKDAGMDEGDTYRVKATVKDHGEYNGRPQTVVNRVAVLECVNEAA